MRLAITLLAALAGAALLLSLGVWQVQRLEWKQGVLAELEARLHALPEPLPVAPDPARDALTPVRLTGTIGDEELRVMASSKRLGPVFRIVSPFETDDGRRVLLDRGAVPAAARDEPRTGGRATVLGNLHWPDERDGWTPADEPAANLWYARDVDAMAGALATEPVMVVAREIAHASGRAPQVTPLPLDTAGIPNDHLGYAVTWFGLAAAWVAMSAAFLWRQRRPDADPDAARPDAA